MPHTIKTNAHMKLKKIKLSTSMSPRHLEHSYLEPCRCPQQAIVQQHVVASHMVSNFTTTDKRIQNLLESDAQNDFNRKSIEVQPLWKLF